MLSTVYCLVFTVYGLATSGFYFECLPTPKTLSGDFDIPNHCVQQPNKHYPKYRVSPDHFNQLLELWRSGVWQYDEEASKACIQNLWLQNKFLAGFLTN